MSAACFTTATQAVEENGDYQLSETEVSLAMHCLRNLRQLLVKGCIQIPEMALLAQNC